MKPKLLSGILSATAWAALLVAVWLDAPRLIPWAITVVALLAVATVVTWRVPSSVIGWLLMFAAWTTSLSQPLQVLAWRADDPAISGLYSSICYTLVTVGVMALPVILIRFPDGRLLGGRWRPVEWMVVAAAVIGGVAALINGGYGGDRDQAIGQPPLQDAAGWLGDALSSVFFPLMLASMILAAVALVLRFRRSVGEDRLKIKWVAYAAGFLVATFTLLVALGGLWDGSLTFTWQEVLIAVAFAGIPAAIGVAILQYRLYDIDVVISRTVVFAVLAGFVGIVYGLVVVGVGSLLGGRGGGWTPIVATAVVALAFEPVRHVAQSWANRIAYGHRATPYEVLADLTGRLTGSGEGVEILDRMAALLVEGTGAEEATVWLGTPTEMHPVASTREDPVDRMVDLDADTVFPVYLDGEVVGALEVVKPPGAGLSSQDNALMADLAGSAGAVFGYQRLNESLAHNAEQIDLSRRRLVDAEDQERRRLEHELDEGAEQLILALKMNVGLAGKAAAGHDAPALTALLATLAEEAQDALVEVRNLAKGIYPPVLESDGLGPAVSALAAGAPVPVEVSRDGVGRYSPEVEAAVYFDISEALTNAVKHASPPVSIRLEDGDGTLRFRVTDSGPGFDPATAKQGSGLENLYDRMDAVGGKLNITSTPGTGTTVKGEVPVASSIETVLV